MTAGGIAAGPTRAASAASDLIRLGGRPRLAAWYSVAGPEEAQGPLAGRFDAVEKDYHAGQGSFEKAERELFRRAVEGLLARAGRKRSEVDLVLAGDLLNQLVTVHFAMRDLGIPCFGLYSACATLAEALALAAMLVDGGHVRRAVCAVSSHFYTAERQYRFPAEFGNQRAPQSQRTATGAAAFLVEAAGDGEDGDGRAPPFAAGGADIRVTAVTLGRVRDLGVADVNNMGAAEAPAAADTIARHLGAVSASGGGPAYDRVVTGDLAAVGLSLGRDLLGRDGVHLGRAWQDCGVDLYDPARQNVQAGGSGAACSGLVLAARHLPDLAAGRVRTLLFCGTGALHSPTTAQQGDTIPAVCHAVALAAGGGDGR